MSDDLDLDAVGDDLVDVGYAEDEIEGHRHFSIDVLDTAFDGGMGAYPGVEMLNVVLVPDEHLMFIGRTPESVEMAVEVLEDDEDSATDAGAFDDLLEDTDDLEYAVLEDSPECSDPGERGGLEAAGFFLTRDDLTATIVRAFGDDDVVTTELDTDERDAAQRAFTDPKVTLECEPG